VVPTLIGRIQTRLFLLATIGVATTFLIVAVLPASAGTALVVVAAVAVLGIGWELFYHLLMQFRWEKDWPSLFGLVTMLPEGLLLWVLLRAELVPGVTGIPAASTFGIHFGVVWLAVWLVANGPMRVPFIRWRFRGGRLV
jgi:hypothetical protein